MIPDNYDLWAAHDARQERKLRRLPVCTICDDYIQDDHYYDIDGTKICPDCLEYFKVWTDFE